MSHLGESLTALVDGELGHDERDRALAHLAACARCRADAEALRRLKGRLHSLPQATPDDDFVRRLNALGETIGAGHGQGGRDSGDGHDGHDGHDDKDGTAAPRARPMPDHALAPAMVATGRAARRRSGDGGRDRPERRGRGPGRQASAGAERLRRPATRRDTARGRYLLVGAATLAVLGVGAISFAAGAPPESRPQVTPALEQFAVEHALTSGEVPIVDPTSVRDRLGP